MAVFQKIKAEDGADEFAAGIDYQIGKCYFYLNESDQCIKSLTGLLRAHPKHANMKEALFFLGQCYTKKGEEPRAKGFYQQILAVAQASEPIYEAAKGALDEL